MSPYRDYIDVVQRQWEYKLLSVSVRPDAIMRLLLLKSDLISLRIALDDYLTAKSKVNTIIANQTREDTTAAIETARNEAWSRMFHHAKVFTVCMRRIARLLETARRYRDEYPNDDGEEIVLAWKKNRNFFNDYKKARDAIEHIDGEVNGYNKKFLGLRGDYLEVVQGKRALVTLAAFHVAESAWEGIVDMIMRPTEARVRANIVKHLIFVLIDRIEQLSNYKI